MEATISPWPQWMMLIGASTRGVECGMAQTERNAGGINQNKYARYEARREPWNERMHEGRGVMKILSDTSNNHHQRSDPFQGSSRSGGASTRAIVGAATG